MKRQIALIGLVLAISCVGFFGSRAAGGGGGGCFDPVKTQQTSDVRIKYLCFDPTVALIEPGDTVTWTNKDDQPHNVSLANTTWSSRTLRLNDTVSYRFEKPGVFPYVCQIHTGMSGAIVVGEPQTGAIRRGEIGSQVGYTNFQRSKGPGEDLAQGADEQTLSGGDLEPAASRDGGQAFYVFLMLVGALLMVAVIFLALNRKAGRNGNAKRRLLR